MVSLPNRAAKCLKVMSKRQVYPALVSTLNSLLFTNNNTIIYKLKAESLKMYMNFKSYYSSFMTACSRVYLCQACSSGLSWTKWEHVRGAVKEAQMQMCTCVVSQTIWKQTFFGSGITKAFSTLGSSSSTNQRILLDNNFNLCSALIYFNLQLEVPVWSHPRQQWLRSMSVSF